MLHWFSNTTIASLKCLNSSDLRSQTRARSVSTTVGDQVGSPGVVFLLYSQNSFCHAPCAMQTDHSFILSMRLLYCTYCCLKKPAWFSKAYLLRVPTQT